jgi:hypothetical protein
MKSKIKTYVLAHQTARINAAEFCMSAPEGLVVTFREKTRSLEQNARLWVLLGKVAEQVPWTINGQERLLAPEEWKLIFTAGLKREQQIALGIDGGFVVMGSSTSTMTKREMNDLMTLIEAFGAERGVKWDDHD